jgi:hypothetical protein
VAPSRLQRPGPRGSAASNSEGRAGGASRAASMHGRDLPTTRCSFSERCSAVFLEASSSLGRPPAGCMVLTCRRPIQLRPRSRIDVAFRRVPACASGMAPIRPRTSWNARACWSHRLSAPPSICAYLCMVEAVVAVDKALHCRLIDLAEFRRYVAMHPGSTGISQVRRVADLAEPATESAMETRLRVLLYRLGPSSSASSGCAVRRPGEIPRPYRPLLSRPAARPGVRRRQSSGKPGRGQPPPEPPAEGGLPAAPLYRVRRLQRSRRHREPGAQWDWACFRNSAQSEAQIRTTFRKAATNERRAGSPGGGW